MKILAILIFINIFAWNALAAKPKTVVKPVARPSNVRDTRIDPLEEDEICPYHFCPSLKFICAFDGKRYQYFRNYCYMAWHNYCFKGKFRETRNIRGCID